MTMAPSLYRGQEAVPNDRESGDFLSVMQGSVECAVVRRRCDMGTLLLLKLAYH
jgi:hypothetical protein